MSSYRPASMADYDAAPTRDKLEALACLSVEVSRAPDLDRRITEVLASMSRHLGYEHSMLFVPADDGKELTMLACHGYPGGVGASVPLGQGAIGVCGERRRAIRLNNVTRDLDLVRAMQPGAPSERSIPLPGLTQPGSQAAVAAVVEERLELVLYAEAAELGRFTPDDTHALQVVANLLAVAMRESGEDGDDGQDRPEARPTTGSEHLKVRFYEADGSVFFDDEYVIKSLPGRILYRLLRVHHDTGRSTFTNKELRLDPTLKLPPVRDNLDTRLILLKRRLAERFPCVELAPAGRGRFELRVGRPYSLTEASASYP